MGADGERVPVVGRLVLQIAEFCRHTGLSQDVVEPPMRTGQLPGALWKQDGQPFGINALVTNS
ncbi:MAG: hypothetical protein ACRDP1_02315 [Nocardioidaceae bacterium]